MNTCTICGYKAVRKDFFERHQSTHEVTHPEIKEETPVEFVSVEPIPEPVVPVAPVESVPPVEVPANKDITLRFTKSVEIFINAKPYLGKEIVVQDMSIAAEIVRIAREAYGPNILA